MTVDFTDLRVDLDALLCALVLAPHTFARNRFFGLFTRPEARRVRSRALQLRSVVRQLSARATPQGKVVEERLEADGSLVLRYRVDEINLERMVWLAPLEACVLRYALHRAADGSNAELDPHTRSEVERALGRLAPHLDDADVGAQPL
jgi:hypothetical protein